MLKNFIKIKLKSLRIIVVIFHWQCGLVLSSLVASPVPKKAVEFPSVSKEYSAAFLLPEVSVSAKPKP